MPDFRYLTFVFFVPSRLKNIFEPRRRKEHEEKYHFYASPRRGLGGHCPPYLSTIRLAVIRLYRGNPC